MRGVVCKVQATSYHRLGTTQKSNILLAPLGLQRRKGRDTPDAIRQHGTIFQFLKVNKTTNDRK